jgi:DNA primase
LARRLAGDAPEAVRLVEALRGEHALARIEPDRLDPVRARVVEGDVEQLLAQPTAARLGTQVHALQLERALVEPAQRDAAEDLVVVDRDPQRGVCPGRVVEVGIDLGIGLETELAQRLSDERAEAVRVGRLERDDVDYGAARSSIKYSYTAR